MAPERIVCTAAERPTTTCVPSSRAASGRSSRTTSTSCAGSASWPRGPARRRDFALEHRHRGSHARHGANRRRRYEVRDPSARCRIRARAFARGAEPALRRAARPRRFADRRRACLRRERADVARPDGGVCRRGFAGGRGSSRAAGSASRCCPEKKTKRSTSRRRCARSRGPSRRRGGTRGLRSRASASNRDARSSRRPGTTIYRVNAIKRQATRTFVVVDGGLAENPRPALYDARHYVVPAMRPLGEGGVEVTLCGRSCENDELGPAIVPRDLKPSVSCWRCVRPERIPIAWRATTTASLGRRSSASAAGRDSILARRETIDEVLASDAGPW